MNKAEILGLVASVMLLICASIKSHTVKGNILMRIIDIIGSVLFVIYGILLRAYSIIITNTGIAAICCYYLIKLIQTNKKDRNI